MSRFLTTILIHRLGSASGGASNLESRLVHELVESGFCVSRHEGLLPPHNLKDFDLVVATNTVASPFVVFGSNRICFVAMTAFRFQSFRSRMQLMGFSFALVEFFKDFLQSVCLIKAHGLIFFSHHTLRLANLNCKFKTSMTKIIVRQHVTTDYFSYQPTVRRKQAGKINLVYISAFYPYKNHLMLIRSIAAAVDSGVDLSVVFFGKKYHGFENKVVAEIEEKNMGNRIKVLIDSPYSRLSEFEPFQFVFASTFENNCLVFQEMIASGKEIYCADSQVAREFLEGYASFFSIECEESFIFALRGNKRATSGDFRLSKDYAEFPEAITRLVKS